jgi:hypothetical protein
MNGAAGNFSRECHRSATSRVSNAVETRARGCVRIPCAAGAPVARETAASDMPCEHSSTRIQERSMKRAGFLGIALTLATVAGSVAATTALANACGRGDARWSSDYGFRGGDGGYQRWDRGYSGPRARWNVRAYSRRGRDFGGRGRDRSDFRDGRGGSDRFGYRGWDARGGRDGRGMWTRDGRSGNRDGDGRGFRGGDGRGWNGDGRGSRDGDGRGWNRDGRGSHDSDGRGWNRDDDGRGDGGRNRGDEDRQSR